MMKSATKTVQRIRATAEDTVFSKGEKTTLTVVLFKTTDEVHEGDMYIEIAGPSGYHHYDTKKLKKGVASQSMRSHGFKWHIPSNAQTGTYKIMTGLLPPQLSAYDVKYVQVE
jgi:hypothetical protein